MRSCRAFLPCRPAPSTRHLRESNHNSKNAHPLPPNPPSKSSSYNNTARVSLPDRAAHSISREPMDEHMNGAVTDRAWAQTRWRRASDKLTETFTGKFPRRFVTSTQDAVAPSSYTKKWRSTLEVRNFMRLKTKTGLRGLLNDVECHMF